MYSLLSACTCLCLHFLLLCFQVQMFAAEENVDFRIHVENQTRARDDVSRKQLRLYQLYSRTSGKHIQVLGRRISAKGEDGDKYEMPRKEGRGQISGRGLLLSKQPPQVRQSEQPALAP
ncbi:fibroblast growth factor 18-like [Empidonax traillii]|uniref:fibroblast growth factor 18-like n=1 Tax=Empidonax traillii TaxID=164674 RepID=UPI000FFDBADC|nr:fibroblast growth factor 18-like [Empidonax traillii]